MPFAALPTLQQQLQALIQTPSVSATSSRWDMPNRPVIDLLASWLEQLGFHCEIQEIPGYPGKANLLATLGSGPGGLVLAGHTDTVPFDESRWSSDPFTLTERDNRWYGLGTTDMKGFFPIAIEAARRFVGRPLRHPLIILATADEESSMCGARQLVAAGRPRARWAVVGEPTGLRPIRAHKGMMMEAVRLRGQAGHSSVPQLGNSALEGMHQVIGELLQLRQELQQRYQDPSFSVPQPTLNLGCIHGGDNPNRICGECELQFDLRPLPGMALDELRGMIRQRLQAVTDPLGLQFAMESTFEGVEPFAEAVDSELVLLAEKLTGHRADSVAFATEGPYFQQLGMQTIVMGPGSIDQAHQPDEFLALDQINPAIQLLEQMIEHCCCR